MKVLVSDTADLMAAAAADHAAAVLRRVIAERGRARVIAATGTSQIAFLRALVRARDIDWSRVDLFQLDEYVGLPIDHPARFDRFLRERLIGPAGVGHAHLIDPNDPERSMRDLGAALAVAPVDVAFLGIGENGHLAFNDPPADFETPAPYIVVSLDDACRRQQVGEGWFTRLEDVPATAITMSIRQMLAARELVVVVPDARKAPAVRATLEGEIAPAVPASILRTHDNATLFLDAASAASAGPETESPSRVVPRQSPDR